MGSSTGLIVLAHVSRRKPNLVTLSRLVARRDDQGNSPGSCSITVPCSVGNPQWVGSRAPTSRQIKKAQSTAPEPEARGLHSMEPAMWQLERRQLTLCRRNREAAVALTSKTAGTSASTVTYRCPSVKEAVRSASRIQRQPR